MDRWIVDRFLDHPAVIPWEKAPPTMPPQDPFIEKYQLLIPFLEATYFKAKGLIKEEIKAEEPLLTEYVVLLMERFLKEGRSFSCTMENLDYAESISPDILSKLAEQKRQALENLYD